MPTCSSVPRLTLLRAAAAQIDLVRRMAAEAFPATYRTILSPGQIDYMMEWMYSAATLRREMEGPFAWFVAEADGTPCGYLSIEDEGLRDGVQHFQLQKIYLLPAFQHRGLGGRLFGEALGWMRRNCPPGALGCRMELHVNRSNPALGFYRHMGMETVRAGDFPIGGGYLMNDYVMGMML